jgi:hypothetical protein
MRSEAGACLPAAPSPTGRQPPATSARTTSRTSRLRSPSWASFLGSSSRLIGVAGALGGGWAATKIFHIHTLHGFFNASTWLTAIAGAAILLLAYHLATRNSGGSRSGRSRRRYAHR